MPATTQGRWEQKTAFSDGQIFVGASDFSPLVAADGVLTSAGAGLLTRNVPVSVTANLFANISALLRTGQLATPAINQEQFGTAKAVPGPSTVVNTSDPFNLPPGFPPWLAKQLPTVSGNPASNVPTPKGIQVNAVDVTYEVDTGAVTSVTFGLTATKMPAAGVSAAPVVSNIIALGANSLPVAANTAGQVTTTRIAVTTPAFTILNDTELIANINFVVPAANTVKFYGVILQVSFNFN